MPLKYIDFGEKKEEFLKVLSAVYVHAISHPIFLHRTTI